MFFTSLRRDLWEKNVKRRKEEEEEKEKYQQKGKVAIWWETVNPTRGYRGCMYIVQCTDTDTLENSVYDAFSPA